MKKRILFLFTAFVICIGMLPSGVTSAAANGATPSSVSLIESNEVCTTAEEAAAQARRHMANREGSFKVTIGTASDAFDTQWVESVKDAVLEMLMDHTGISDEGDYLRYHTSSYSASAGSQYSESGDGLTTCELSFSCRYYTTASQESEVAEKIDEILYEIISPCMTEYGKLKAIYDYICANVEYSGGGNFAYNAVVNGSSNCRGFAAAIYRMALECGIECRHIVGKIKNYGSEDAYHHEWNIVGLDGKYYLTDAASQAYIENFDFLLMSKRSFLFSNYTAESDYAADYAISSSDYSKNNPTITHSIGDMLTQGKETHYYECSRCGLRSDEAPHEFMNFRTNGNGTHTGKCICGKEFSENCSGGSAGCDKPKICIICNSQYGDDSGHSYTKHTSNADGTHTSTCVCGKSLTEACSGGIATCTQKKHCEVCKSDYGELDKTNHSADTFVFTSDNKQTHTKRYSCCNEIVASEDHTFAEDGICNLCGESEQPNIDSGEDSGGDNGDSGDNGSSDSSWSDRWWGTIFGSNKHEHNNDTLVKVSAAAATCEKNGNIVHWKCKKCDKLYADLDGEPNLSKELKQSDVTVKAIGHSYNSDNICLHCGNKKPSSSGSGGSNDGWWGSWWGRF